MKEIDFKDNINCIRETAPGRFRIILDFATTRILPSIISQNFKYIWVHNHKPGKGCDWEEFNLPIKSFSENKNVLAKSVIFDFILPTEEFEKIMTEWKGGIQLIQMNNIPPYYLDLNKIHGNKRYEILKNECDYLFEIDIPSATDYGTLISNDKDFLVSILENPNIDWNNLP